MHHCIFTRRSRNHNPFVISGFRRHDLYSEVKPLTDHTCLPEDDFVFKFGPVTVPGAAIFMRSEHSVAFVNKKPVVEGHVLVSSNRMVAQVWVVMEKKFLGLKIGGGGF